jgi:hypothetical protein
MAKVELNAITQHFRGRVGDVVFRTSYGRLQATLRQKKPTTPPTPEQIAQRVEFRKGISYAQAALADPVTRGVYENAGRAHQMSALAAAVGDYFKPPAIDDIDVSGYRGRVGDRILVMASDDVAVKEVTVAVRKADGTVIEQGPAVLQNLKWRYAATTAVAAGEQVVVDVTAQDWPGNAGRAEKPYTLP